MQRKTPTLPQLASWVDGLISDYDDGHDGHGYARVQDGALILGWDCSGYTDEDYGDYENPKAWQTVEYRIPFGVRNEVGGA